MNEDVMIRLNEAYNHLRINGLFSKQEEAANILGMSRTNLSSALNGKESRLTLAFIQNFCDKFDTINKGWLLTGEGDMLVSSSHVENPTTHEKKSPSHADESTKEEEMVKVLPIAAHGGSLTGFSEAANDYDCEWMPSPFKGADFAIDVVGDSMAPEYPSGSRVIIKRINDAAFIEWGKVYVLDTENGVVLKKVVHTEKSDSLHCVSLNPNPDYAPFDIPRSSIYGIYRVLGLLAKK